MYLVKAPNTMIAKKDAVIPKISNIYKINSFIQPKYILTYLTCKVILGDIIKSLTSLTKLGFY